MKLTLIDGHTALLSPRARLTILVIAGVATLSACRSEPTVVTGSSAKTAAASDDHGDVRLRVEGLTCEGCASAIRDGMKEERGVSGVTTSVRERLVTIRYDHAQTTPAKLKEALAQLGYPATDATAAATAAVTIPVEGMSCAACAARMKRGLMKADGVVAVDVSLEKSNARVRFVPTKTNPDQLAAAIRGMDLTPGAPGAVSRE